MEGRGLTRSFPLFHLPQAVNTFQKERGHSKRRGTFESQNPTLAPSPVPTPQPPAMQSQPQKTHQSTHSQQVSHWNLELFTQKFTFSSTNSVTFCFLLHLVFALLLKDPLLHCPMAVDTPSTSEVCGSPPTEIGPVAASDVPSTSLQPVQSHQEAANK